MTEAQKRANNKHLKENYTKKTTTIRKEKAERLKQAKLKISFNKLSNILLDIILLNEENEAIKQFKELYKIIK